MRHLFEHELQNVKGKSYEIANKTELGGWNQRNIQSSLLIFDSVYYHFKLWKVTRAYSRTQNLNILVLIFMA